MVLTSFSADCGALRVGSLSALASHLPWERLGDTVAVVTKEWSQAATLDVLRDGGRIDVDVLLRGVRWAPFGQAPPEE